MNYILEIRSVINHIVHILMKLYCRFQAICQTIQMILVNSDLLCYSSGNFLKKVGCFYSICKLDFR